MKNKKALYILLPLVAIIWGAIFYRIFSAAGPKGADGPENVAYSSFLPAKSTIDTFSLHASYRDPFLGKMAVIPSENEKPKTPIKKIEKPKPEPVQWPAVIYKGMIKNQQTNKQLYLVTINNQDNMMKQGDVSGEVELKKAYKDSIQVVYKKEVKTFKK